MKIHPAFFEPQIDGSSPSLTRKTERLDFFSRKCGNDSMLTESTSDEPFSGFSRVKKTHLVFTTIGLAVRKEVMCEDAFG